jgi:hypothetical protein
MTIREGLVVGKRIQPAKAYFLLMTLQRGIWLRRNEHDRLKELGHCRYWRVSKGEKKLGLQDWAEGTKRGRYTNDMMNTMNGENNSGNEYGQRIMKFPKALFLFLSVLSYVFLS